MDSTSRRPIPDVVKSHERTHRNLSEHNRRRAAEIDMVILVLSAAIPVAAATSLDRVWIVVLGGGITVLTALRQQRTWAEN